MIEPMIDFLKRALSLFELCPSDKVKNCKIKSIKDECLEVGKDFNSCLQEEDHAESGQLFLDSQV